MEMIKKEKNAGIKSEKEENADRKY